LFSWFGPRRKFFPLTDAPGGVRGRKFGEAGRVWLGLLVRPKGVPGSMTKERSEFGIRPGEEESEFARRASFDS